MTGRSRSRWYAYRSPDLPPDFVAARGDTEHHPLEFVLSENRRGDMRRYGAKHPSTSLNPQVLGSNPRGPTTTAQATVRALARYWRGHLARPDS